MSQQPEENQQAGFNLSKSYSIGSVENATILQGENNNIVNSDTRNNLVDVTSEIEGILNSLAERYPNASEPQKQIVFQMELQQKIKNNPSLRDRFVSAAKAGSVELVKVLTNNPFVSVPLETVKGWLEAEPS